MIPSGMKSNSLTSGESNAASSPRSHRVRLVFLGCIGEDTDAIVEQAETDIATPSEFDGRTNASLDWAAPLAEDMALMIDMEIRCGAEEQQLSSTTCGLNGEGFLIQICVEGMWTTTDRCSGSDECVNGDQRNGNTPCGPNDEGSCSNSATMVVGLARQNVTTRQNAVMETPVSRSSPVV